MKMRHFLAVLSLSAIISGCVPSIHPLYTDKDIIFDPALIGMWGSEDPKFQWEFFTEDSLSYTLIYSEDSVPATFTAHLVLLGNQLFMDLFPDEPDIANEFYKMVLISAHSFYKVTLESNTLRLDPIDMEWLEKMIDIGTVKIAHEKLDENRILLTANTSDLQALVTKYAADKDAFAKSDEMYRKE